MRCQLEDPLRDISGVLSDFMLPYPDGSPAQILESDRLSKVPLTVTGKLGLPENLVRLWHNGVGRALVPEATIYEDGDLPAGEGDVDSANTGDMEIDPVACPASVEQSAYGQLRCGVPSSDPAHDFRAGQWF